MADIDAEKVRSMSFELAKILTPIINDYVNKNKDVAPWEMLTIVAHGAGITAGGLAFSQSANPSIGIELTLVMREAIANIMADFATNPIGFAEMMTDKN